MSLATISTATTPTRLLSSVLLSLSFITLLATTSQAQIGTAQLHKLTASDGAERDDFGFSVAISGNIAIVGAYLGNDNDRDSGSAYLFDITTGDQLAKLTASDGAERDFFGDSVAISGNTAIIGAVLDDDNGSSSGSAYLFDVTTGDQLAKLTANDAAPGDFFGSSVAISDNSAIVGAYQDDDKGDRSGSAYLFDITTGDQLAKLTASDGAGDDIFGQSVAISGNTAIVGAEWDDDNGSNSGSAYLFDVTTGNQLDKLTANDAAPGDFFGRSVAISGNTAIVGAYRDNDNGIDSGSAYLFDITTGDQLAKLTASDGAAQDEFGVSVAISGNIAIVGAVLNVDNGSRSGSAYLFDITTGDQLAKLIANDGAANDYFGRSVAISGNTVIVGADLDDDNGSSSGSAYLFQVPEPGSIVLLALGVIGLLLFRSRRVE